jgi:carboxypeptidase T
MIWKLIDFVIILMLISIVSPNIIGLTDIEMSNKQITNDSYESTYYYSYDDLLLLLDNLSNNYADIIKYYSIGKTYEHRDIWLIEISKTVDSENSPGILFMGGVHGNEKPGYQVIIYTLETFVKNYQIPLVNDSFTQRIRYIVNNSILYFIPMVNPDGVESNNRKNKEPNDCIFGDSLFSGVDINRNFGFKWDEFDLHPLYYSLSAIPTLLRRANIQYPLLDFWSIVHDGVYRGPDKFSENESIAIKNFVERHNITISVDYHTSGQKILYPWTWTDNPPEDESTFISIASNISKINDYSIQQGGKWYPILGSSKDWLYGEHGIFSFTIELCPSGIQAPKDIDLITEICKTHVNVNMFLAEQAIKMN